MQFDQELSEQLARQIPAFYFKLLNFVEKFDNDDNMSNEAAGALGELVDDACIMYESLQYGMQTPEEKDRSERERQAKIDAVMKANYRPPHVTAFPFCGESGKCDPDDELSFDERFERAKERCIHTDDFYADCPF